MQFDVDNEIRTICENLRSAVLFTLSKKGIVVGMSGGIDSSVCAAIAVQAFEPEKVFGLLMPEREASVTGGSMAEALCRDLRIPYEIFDISEVLEAIGCYRSRDEAIRSLFPGYGPGWKSKIAISSKLLEEERYNYFSLIVESPGGVRESKRLPLTPYLEIVAATNFKQRIRKTIEYCHADKKNYAVAGTPNRLEYDQGFFVKNGDGSADVKPIAHLYKSQVFAIGEKLGIPDAVLSSPPTTGTYSMPQTQAEFYFSVPYQTLDLILYGLNHGFPSGKVATEAGLTSEQVERIFRDIRMKRKTTRPLHMKPILLGAIPEIPTNFLPPCAE